MTVLSLVTEPVDVPFAIIVGALYLQPAALMTLPRRGASLDLAAGVVASFLGIGLLLLPYALAFTPLLVVAALSVVCGIAAIGANSYSRTRGDALVALLAIVLIAAATFAPEVASEIEHLFRCRSGPVPLFCVTDEITYVGAAATVAALWLACFVVWSAARKVPQASPRDAPKANAAER